MEVPVKALIIIYIILFFSSFCLLSIDNVSGAGSLVVGISRYVAAPSLVGFNFQASVVVLCAADVVVQQCPVLGQNL